MGWGPLAATFGTVFLAELPDKTSWVAMSLAGGHPRRRRALWAGAAAAFGAQTGLALAAGRALAGLPAGWAGLAAGVLFLAFGVHFLAPERERLSPLAAAPPFWQAFVLVGLAEFGDLTQALTVAAVLHYPRRALGVAGSAWLALAAAAAVSVWAGGAVAARLPETWFRRLAGLIFAGLGAWLLGRWTWDRLC